MNIHSNINALDINTISWNIFVQRNFKWWSQNLGLQCFSITPQKIQVENRKLKIERQSLADYWEIHMTLCRL